jgi:hypothetical protein
LDTFGEWRVKQCITSHYGNQKRNNREGDQDNDDLTELGTISSFRKYERENNWRRTGKYGEM